MQCVVLPAPPVPAGYVAPPPVVVVCPYHPYYGAGMHIAIMALACISPLLQVVSLCIPVRREAVKRSGCLRFWRATAENLQQAQEFASRLQTAQPQW